MDQANNIEAYPTLKDHISQDTFTSNVDKSVKTAQKNAVDNIGTGKIILPFDDLINSENNELDVKNNFVCLICKNMAVAPVM
jgi:hypothetical protein